MTANQALSIEEGQELLHLCRVGKLYEVEAWISSGKSTQIPKTLKKTPLRVAIDLGFYSLVQLLAVHENNPHVLNDALDLAVELRSVEFVRLLLNNGAEIRGIPLISVLRSWDPVLIQLFLDGGADVVSGYPFAIAFGEKIRTALSRFVAYRKSNPELERQLQDQVNRALRFFCREGDLKWVNLLMWAGGDPRVPGVTLDEEDDPESYLTALQETAFGHHVQILKRMKLNHERDDLADLLRCACTCPEIDAIRYLLEIGVKPNDKQNGGSSALDRCLGFMHIEGTIRRYGIGLRSKWDVHRSMDAVSELAQHGALWRPDERSQVNWVCRTLLECEPEVTIELLRVLQSSNACTRETLRELLSRPRIREHLSPQKWWIARLKLTDLMVSQKRAKRSKSDLLVVSRVLLSRYNREDLYEKVWSQPMRKLSKEYGMSDVGLAKICKKLGVPLPGRGYWAKTAARRAVPHKPPLRPIIAE